MSRNGMCRDERRSQAIVWPSDGKVPAPTTVPLVSSEVAEIMRVAHRRQITRFDVRLAWLGLLVFAVLSLLKSRAAVQLENVALRHQLAVLQESVRTRCGADRDGWYRW